MVKRPRNQGGPYRPTRGPRAGETFPSYRQYRNAIERERGFSSLFARQRQHRPTYTPELLSGLSPPERAARERAWKAAELKRADKGLSKVEAARRVGTTPNAIEKYVGPAWPSSLTRWSFLSEDGIITLDVRDRRTASTMGRYWSAVRKYLDGKGDADLQQFKGKSIIVNGERYVFVTDTNVIDYWGEAGELRIDYASGDAAD
jgi:hypothetical protein